MKKLFLLFVSIFTFAFTQIDSVFAIAVEGVDYPFWYTTIPGYANSSEFILSAKGTFYIDCVDGTLSQGSNSGSTISGGTVTRASVTQGNYKCTWSDKRAHTVRIGGLATAYPSSTGTTKTLGFNRGNASNVMAAASFVNTLHGDLSVIFPILGTSSGQFPIFRYLVYKQAIFSIPDTLFSGYTTSGKNMFMHAFEGCSYLGGFVSPNLFAGLIANGSPYATSMMAGIFSSNNMLTSCPSGTTQVTTGYESYWNNKVSCSGNPTVNITYSCGNGSGTPPSGTTITYNSEFTPPAITCTPPTGYNVDGGWWNSSSGNAMAPGIAFQWQYLSDTTLTASYAANQYTVTYVCGSGSGNAPTTNTTATYSSSFTPATNTCTPPVGYHFSGWLVEGTNTVVNSAFTWTYTEDKTFTAQYTINTINITWDGASGTPASCTYGSTFVPPTPAPRTGYIFNGWKVKTVNP